MLNVDASGKHFSIYQEHLVESRRQFITLALHKMKNIERYLLKIS